MFEAVLAKDGTAVDAIDDDDDPPIMLVVVVVGLLPANMLSLPNPPYLLGWVLRWE
jgi:hypothetical protein